jgi:hypothetical protein
MDYFLFSRVCFSPLLAGRFLHFQMTQNREKKNITMALPVVKASMETSLRKGMKQIIQHMGLICNRKQNNYSYR